MSNEQKSDGGFDVNSLGFKVEDLGDSSDGNGIALKKVTLVLPTAHAVCELHSYDARQAGAKFILATASQMFASRGIRADHVFAEVYDAFERFNEADRKKAEQAN